MSYIGQRPVVGRYIKLDQISSGFNGSETSFSMTAGSQAVFPGTARNLLLSLGGVIQEPDTNFTISGSTLTFTTAPVANTTFFAVIFGDMQSTGTPSDGTVLPASIASSGNFSFPQLTVTGTSSLGDDVTFTGANYNVVWDKSADALEFPDGAKAVFGTGSDVEIYHDGTNSRIHSSSHNLYIRTGGIFGVFNGAGSETMLKATVDGAVELYYDNSKKFETTSLGVDITGTTTDDGARHDGDVYFIGATSGRNAVWDMSDNALEFADSAVASFGDSADLRIYHNGSDSVLQDQGTGSLLVISNTFHIKNAANNETLAKFIEDGAVELYHNNSKKFETTSTGVSVTGGLTTSGSSTFNEDVFFIGASSKTITFDQSEGHIRYLDNAKAQFGTQGDLNIYHDGSHSYVQEDGTGHLKILGSTIQLGKTDNSELGLTFTSDGSIQLRYDNSTKLETTSDGVDVTGSLSVANHITLPDQASGVGKIKLGDGVDFQLYHTGTGSVIENRTGNLIFYITSTGEVAAKFIPNGATELYYDNSKKLETLSYGIQVFGAITAGNNINFGDNTSKFMSGSANQLQMHYDGSQGNINVTSASSLLLKTNDTTRLSIDSLGNVGIGTTNPNGESINGSQNLVIMDTTSDGGMNIKTGTSANAQIHFSDTSGNGQGRLIYDHSSDSMKFFTDGSERMRIDSSGSVFIGTTSGGNTGSYFQNDNNDRKTLHVASSSTATQNQIIFRNPNDRVGTIQTSGTSTSYNTTFSDIASKKNFENWTEDVLSLFKNINPQKFNFKVEDDSASKSKGFIAQEMVDKFPEAYVKQEDEMYMFNPSGMVVYLMKALQESVVKIEALETKVAALEAA